MTSRLNGLVFRAELYSVNKWRVLVLKPLHNDFPQFVAQYVILTDNATTAIAKAQELTF